MLAQKLARTEMDGPLDSLILAHGRGDAERLLASGQAAGARAEPKAERGRIQQAPDGDPVQNQGEGRADGAATAVGLASMSRACRCVSTAASLSL